eukprot:3452280-Rhodomonas_salina.1
MLAPTLTAGDAWSSCSFVTTNVKTYVVFASSPELATVNVRLPSPWSHAPVASNALTLDTARLDVSSVAAPVSPEIVTSEPAATSTLVCSDTVSVLSTIQIGVSCSICSTVKTGWITLSGYVPFATPRRLPNCFVIARATTAASI